MAVRLLPRRELAVSNGRILLFARLFGTIGDGDCPEGGSSTAHKNSSPF